MVISDTHNDIGYTELALALFDKEKFDRLFVLGDIGIVVIRKLNPYASKITAVKGNNDGFEDEEDIARFPLPYLNFTTAFGKFIVLTHGHYYNAFNYTDSYDILLVGHTHISGIQTLPNGRIVANPGSLALPNDGYHSYIVMDEKGMQVKDINSQGILHSLTF